MSELIYTIEQWASLIRDIGFILGVPTIIVIGMKLYGGQIELMKARNDLLKETQYDRALAIIKSQKELFERERQDLDNQIEQLKSTGEEKDNEIKFAEIKLNEIKNKIDVLDKSYSNIQQANFVATLFKDDVSFNSARFTNKVDFSYALFDDEVSFEYAAFNKRVIFDGARLINASFKDTDFRDVDLSDAHMNETTKLPKIHKLELN